MGSSTPDLPAPVAARLRRPGWRDPRLLVGLALVAASVALGSWALRAAERTVPVYVARATTVPGTAIDAGALTVADVRLGAVDLARYLRADQPLPSDAVAVRVVEAGELLPAAAVGSADDLALRPVSVPVPGQVPEAVRPGARVDLWLSPAGGASSDEPASPTQLAAALTVAEVDRPQGAFAAGGTTTVHVLVPTERLPEILGALASDGRVDVVAVPGS